MKNIISISISFLIGIVIWFLPEPIGVHKNGWELFAIFSATMVAVILRPLPMGVIAIISLTVATVTGVLSFTDAFSGFSNEIVWLILLAFFIARGFILTGLGTRVAYKVMSVLGKNSLGLGYGLVATDLLLAPAIPSMTARAGGIIYPVVKALSAVFTGKSHDPKMGGYLSLTAFQGSVITSAMFLTAMAGNPLIIELAKGQGVQISWMSWMIAAAVPGLVSLLVVPYVLYKLATPTIRQTPHAKAMAHEQLKEMGPMSKQEWIMLATFAFLIIFWIVGPYIAMKATVVALVGLIILLCSGVLTWRDVIEETGAWDTFIWFSTFVALSGFLNKFGLSTWFSGWVVTHVSGFGWVGALILLSLVYFYTHYFFASNVAHVGAMYAPFLIVSIALGAPAELAALILAFFSSLFGGLTHYGSGPAPIFFGAGYVSVPTWWKMGFIVSVINIVIWVVVGGLWWKAIGLW